MPPRPEIVGAIHEGADRIPPVPRRILLRSGARVASRGRRPARARLQGIRIVIERMAAEPLPVGRL
jgi:hypothetical protein